METDLLRTVDPHSLGGRLQEARRASGFTQQGAADHIGVARTTLTAIEQGERRIQAGELVRLAALYGRSVGELLRRGEPVEPLALQLRNAPAVKAVGEEEIAPEALEFQRLCEDYLELERLNNAPLPRRYPAEYQIGAPAMEAEAEDVAVTERNRLGLGDGPVLNLRGAFEQDVGLRVFYMDLPPKLGAMYAFTDQLGGCIAVNRNHPEELRRMSLSHDYGHFLTSRYRPAVDVAGRYHRIPEYERFAESFGRAFLMPATGVTRRFNDLRRSREGTITPADLSLLAHFYFVSLTAMVLRLEELRLLKTGTWDRLQQAGFRVREAQAILNLPPHPVNDQLLPQWYLYLAVSAYQRGDLSEGQLARYLRTDRLEARRVVEEIASYQLRSDAGLSDTHELDLDATLPTGSGQR